MESKLGLTRFNLEEEEEQEQETSIGDALLRAFRFRGFNMERIRQFYVHDLRLDEELEFEAGNTQYLFVSCPSGGQNIGVVSLRFEVPNIVENLSQAVRIILVTVKENENFERRKIEKKKNDSSKRGLNLGIKVQRGGKKGSHIYFHVFLSFYKAR